MHIYNKFKYQVVPDKYSLYKDKKKVVGVFLVNNLGIIKYKINYLLKNIWSDKWKRTY